MIIDEVEAAAIALTSTGACAGSAFRNRGGRRRGAKPAPSSAPPGRRASEAIGSIGERTKSTSSTTVRETSMQQAKDAKAGKVIPIVNDASSEDAQPIANKTRKPKRAAPLGPAFSDEALALRFAERHANDLRYVAAWSKWLHWDGRRWAFDDTHFRLSRGPRRLPRGRRRMQQTQ